MRIAPAESQTGRKPRRSEPVILFSISGQTLAINANAIHEIRSTDSISAAAMEIPPSGLTKVRHVLHHAQGSLFVVNGHVHFGLPASRAEHVVILRNSRIALLVNTIERMAAMSVLMALPPGFSGPERSWYRGITVMDGNVIPVINPAGFLSDQEIEALDAAVAQTGQDSSVFSEHKVSANPEQQQ